MLKAVVPDCHYCVPADLCRSVLTYFRRVRDVQVQHAHARYIRVLVGIYCERGSAVTCSGPFDIDQLSLSDYDLGEH